MLQILVNDMLITVKVENQKILLPIGWYEEEQITKTELEISVLLKYQVNSIIDELDKTIDYQLISKLIGNLKLKQFKLLEFAANDLLESLERILFNSVDIKHVQIEFKKKNIAQYNVSCDFHSILVEKSYP